MVVATNSLAPSTAAAERLDKVASPSLDVQALSTEQQLDPHQRPVSNTLQQQQIADVPLPSQLLLLKTPRRLPSSFPLQRWEGVVDWVDGDEFGATLLDLTANSEREQVDFSVDEVSQDDRSLVRPGAVFYWTIARGTTASGQRVYESLIAFRRIPAWTQRQLAEARERADAVNRRLGFH